MFSAKPKPIIRKMYSVDKFLPPECPKCRHKFDKNGEDWAWIWGDIVNGKKVIRETTGYKVIQCLHCDNFTAYIPLESWQVSSLERAEELLKQGFVNLMEGEMWGAKEEDFYDRHVVCAKIPDVRVEGIYPDQNNRSGEK